MADVLIEEQSMTNIADEIRKKLSTVNRFKPSEMADAIDDIEESSVAYKKVGQLYTSSTGNYFDIEASD